MTEGEWLSCDDPAPMLVFLRGRAGERKVRLFACACCRLVWHLLTDEPIRRAVEVTERYADGEASDDEAEAVGARTQRAFYRLTFGQGPGRGEVRSVWFGIVEGTGSATVTGDGEVVEEPGEFRDVLGSDDPFETAIYTAGVTARAVTALSGGDEAVGAGQSRLLSGVVRDVFGNPFRPVTADPRWRTAVALARAIYADRAFDRLPILADALEDAGCDNADVLNHLRGDGPHVRGCWAVDLVLGKG